MHSSPYASETLPDTQVFREPHKIFTMCFGGPPYPLMLRPMWMPISLVLKSMPPGYLQVSPYPDAHLVMDFVTDLSTSHRYIVILVAVDQFSKACKLIPHNSPQPWKQPQPYLNSSFVVMTSQRT